MGEQEIANNNAQVDQQMADLNQKKKPSSTAHGVQVVKDAFTATYGVIADTVILIAGVGASLYILALLSVLLQTTMVNVIFWFCVAALAIMVLPYVSKGISYLYEGAKERIPAFNQ